MKLADAQTITAKMMDALVSMKRLYGDEWPEKSAQAREIISAAMLAKASTNPVEAMLPLAIAMDKAGHNPIILIAVAAEMSL